MSDARWSPSGRQGLPRQPDFPEDPNGRKVVPSYRDLQKTQCVFADVGKRFGRCHKV